MFNKELGAYVAVISHNRPDNVPVMQEKLGPCTWHVHAGDDGAYRKAGATRTIAIAENLVENRNSALDEAFQRGKICVQLDDDLIKIERCTVKGGKVHTLPVDFMSSAAYMLRCLERTSFKLAGVAPVCNAFYFSPDKPFSYANFIPSKMIVVMPTDLRFDSSYWVKEDYDYTAQHVTKYGGVCRVNALMPVFGQYRNKGGCVDYRTPEVEAAAVNKLMQKWPGYFRLNPKRENEVIMKVPAELRRFK